MIGLDWLRDRPAYLDFRWSTREGLWRAWRRRQIQRKILKTPPLRTARSGPVEVRVLTWRRDYLDVIWALKSFYFHAQVNYPLFIHDGGLSPEQAQLLKAHFPAATIVRGADADSAVREKLGQRGLRRCLEYRSLNVTTRKLFDFFLLSSADYIISIDSDIVFFRKPELLIVPPGGVDRNRYNRDASYWYSMAPEELESAFGFRPVERINSGLSLIRRSSIDFDAIERWLANPKLFADRWVTEQTLHAMCSSLYGVELLPDTYCVSTSAGLSPEMVCKHYPGFFRTLHYEEGMRHLIESGFLKELRRTETTPASPARESAEVS